MAALMGKIICWWTRSHRFCGSPVCLCCKKDFTQDWDDAKKKIKIDEIIVYWD